MTGQTEEDVPETGAIFTFGQSSFADDVPSTFWLKNDHPGHISCGGEHTAVTTEHGRLLMFGVNTWGQLGLGFKPTASKPVSVKALKTEKMKLAACGKGHTIVCTWRGNVYCVGNNREGQLGLGHCDNTPSFELLHPFCDYAPIKMVSAGFNTSAALTEDGRLFMWGDNSVGQVGLGDEGFAAQPTQLDVGEAVIWVSCGYHHSAFVTAGGSLYTFGESAYGRLGLQVEQLANHRVPQQVRGILGRVIQVSCGGEHTIALTDENVYTFGRGQYGQLGHGTFLFQADLPKSLEHFSNSTIRHVACGENHSAVITHSGLLYTFGDGRHGKLALAEENFINQFSPTLCTGFLKYDVQLVSCGGNHTLVLAAPRLLESQEGPDRKVTVGDIFLDPSYTEIPLIGPTSLVPLSALHARARHREKESSAELFGKLFQNLPHLHSGFLNTSWPTSRNILTPKTRSRNITSTSSSPKPQSDITPSTPLSPRSPKASHSPLFSSAPSSPRSQSSNTTSKSKPKELPSSLLLPQSVKKRNIPVSPGKTTKQVHRVVTAKKTLNVKVSSAQSPVEPCSPNRPPTHVSSKQVREEEHPALPQTAGELVERQLVTEDRKKKRDDSKTLEKRKALPTELLKVSSSLKSPLKSTEKKITSKGKENITSQSITTKTQEDKQYQKEFSHLKSSKRGEAKQELGQQKTLTEAQGKVKNRNGRNTNTDQENVKYCSDKINLMGPLEKGKPKPTALAKTPSVIKATNRSERTSTSVQSGRSTSVEESKEEAYTQRKPTAVKPARSEVESTSTHLQKVKSITDKGQSKTLNVKSHQVKNAAGDETSRRLRSLPVKVKGKVQHVTSTPVKNQSRHDENAKGRKEGIIMEKGLKLAKNSSQKLKGKPADKETLAGADSNKTEEESKLKAKAKPGGEERQEIQIKEEANVDRKSDKRPEVKTKLTGKPVTSQSSKRPELASAKSLQSSKPVQADFLESDRDDTKQKPAYGEILTNVTSLLPAVALAGSAVGVISEAVTSVQSLQSDNDSTSTSQKGPKQKQIMKQSAVMQQSFSSTLTDLSSAEASDLPGQSTNKEAQVNVLSESGNAGQEESDFTEVQEDEEEEDRESSEDEEEQSASEGAGKGIDNETEGAEKTSSSSEEEDEGSEKGDATEAEGEEEGSSEETAESESDSEVNEAAEDKEESEKSSEAESNEAEEEAEMSEDEEDESGDESEITAGSKSEEDEDREGSDTSEAEPGTSEEDDEEEGHEADEDEDGETEDQKEDQDYTETEDEHKSSEEDETEENKKNSGTSDENEEEEEHSESEQDGENEENEEEEEEEEENKSELEKEEENEEEEEEEEEEEDEEEGVGEEEEEEDLDDVEGEEEEAEEEEGEGEGEEEEKIRNNKSIRSNKKAMVETEEEEEGNEEEEEAEDSDEEDDETPIKSKTEKRLQNQREEKKMQQNKGKKGHDSEQSEDESEEEEENDGEEDDDEEEEQESEEDPTETAEGEEQEEEGEEEEDEEEEDEEKEKGKSTKIKHQKLPLKEKQLKEAPKPAPRTRQRSPGEKKPEPQQFWDSVLPQYLDLQ